MIGAIDPHTEISTRAIPLEVASDMTMNALRASDPVHEAVAVADLLSAIRDREMIPAATGPRRSIALIRGVEMTHEALKQLFGRGMTIQ